MSIFASLKRNDAVQEVQDSLGGFSRLESDIYPMTVTMAYSLVSKGGANGVFMQFAGAGGKEYQETFYVTSGTEKGCKHTYEDRNGKTHYMMGFTIVNDIALVTTGKELFELTQSEKDVPAWDTEEKKETIQKKQVFTELLGKPVSLGILKTLEDKYQEETSSVERNAVDKVFKSGEMVTVVEGEAGLTEGEFFSKWLEKNKGVTGDKRVQSKDSNGKAGAPATGGPATAPKTKSLFGNKSE